MAHTLLFTTEPILDCSAMHVVGRRKRVLTANLQFAGRFFFSSSTPYELLDNGHRVAVFTPDELRTVLSTVTPDWLPAVAIGAFTGLRRAEVERLAWSEVKLDRRLIDLPYTKSKNGRRKLIAIPENLAAILGSATLASEERVVPNRRFDLEVKRLKETLGIGWPPNVLRHSFCSYAVAVHGFVWTAEQADHSEAILRAHYREVVHREDAEKYWAITPYQCSPH